MRVNRRYVSRNAVLLAASTRQRAFGAAAAVLCVLAACGSQKARPSQAGPVEPPPYQPPPGATVDRFGVPMIYPTAAGGREWTLPDDADRTDATGEWVPVLGAVTPLGGGAFHTDGSATVNRAETRLEVRSPAGKAWWRNVEATWYARSSGWRGSACVDWYDRHFSLAARGERHAGGTTTKAEIDAGVPAPAGTATWPWYAGLAAGASVPAPCLGTVYYGTIHPLNGRVQFEKELSHVQGYAESGGATRGGFTPAAWTDGWFGYKLVVRNYAGDASRVHMELWVDPVAVGSFTRWSSYDDGSGWASTDGLDGCDQAPIGYASDQLITWAGPTFLFRSDCQGLDFRWLSVREVGPIP